MSSQLTTAALAPARDRWVAWLLVHRWRLLVWTSIAVWSSALFAIVRDDYLSFRLPRLDLGNMVQAVWSTAHGRPLEVTGFSGDEMSRLGIHVDPILALLAPAWLVAPTPLTLVAVQIVVCSLGALPVFWLARRYLASEKTAALMALTYLAYPWLAWTASDAMHPLTLSLSLFLFCIWFLDSDRLLAFAGSALLVLATGELMGVTVAALGLWYVLARGHRAAGLLISLVGLSWTLVAVYVVVPHFSGGSSDYFGYYASVGGSPQGVIRTALTDPSTIASALFSSRDVMYVVWLAAPLAFAFLLRSGIAVVAVPQLLASELSDNLAMTHPRHHYIAPLVPFLIAGTVMGIGRLAAHRQELLATVTLLLSLAFSLLVGPWPGVPGKIEPWDSVKAPAGHADALRAAVSLVPGDAAVSATNRAGSHLSARHHVYSVTFVRDAKWIVLDMWDPFVADPGFPVLEKKPDALRAFKLRIEHDARWAQVFERDGVLVFRKAST